MLITIAHSPDSDDIFMFWALKTKKIPNADFDFKIMAQDIETLNQLATKARYDITAISMHAYAYLSNRYALLSSGSSFAEKDWGPILVSKKKQTLSDLSKKQIAVPGLWTTAFLLLKMALPDFEPVVMKPENILPAIQDNRVEAGLLIHEGQICYKDFGVFLIQNMIEVWKKIAGDLPLPLGGSAVKKSLGQTVMKKLSRLQKQSILFARHHFEEAKAYVRHENPVLNDQGLTKYLGWYANDRTVDLGEDGKKALEVLFATAFEKGLIPQKVEIEII